jgi:peroxiredoxin
MALMAFAVMAVAAMAAAVEIGAKAPGFTLKDIKGNEHTLAAYAGRIVVLEWTNHGCPFVKKHYGPGNMQALQEKYTGKDVVWLSICSSALGKQGHFTAEAWAGMAHELKEKASAILLDEDGAVGRLYGAKTTPHMFVIDKEGSLAYQGAIDDDRSFDPKKVEGAKNYVAAAIDALLKGEKVETAETAPYGCSVKY